MKTKFLFLSAIVALAGATAASAQSLFDLQDLFGRQTREQERSVKTEFNADFQYFVDSRSFGACDDLFMDSGLIHVARFSPSLAVRFDQNRSVTHRVSAGLDLTKDLGSNPIKETEYSHSEASPTLATTELLKFIFYYYQIQVRTSGGTFDLYAGIHPRNVLRGDYTRAVFADDIIYYDPNLEGVTLEYSSPKFSAELSADMIASKGIDRLGHGIIFTAGAFRPWEWLSAGWSASFSHASGTHVSACNVDNAVFNPYVKVDFGSKVGMQELSIKAGPLAGFQFDHFIEGEKPHIPMGVETILNIRHWNVGLENTFYYGDNQMIYRSSAYQYNSKAGMYASSLYSGDTFYFTRRGIPSWFNRAELYYAPFSTSFLSAKVSAVGHFIMPAGEVGPFVGWQARASLMFNLEAFKHPRESRDGSRRRTERRVDGPIISL